MEKGRGSGCFSCDFGFPMNLQRLEEQFCSTLQLCFEPAHRLPAYGSALKSCFVKTSIALGLLLTGYGRKPGSAGELCWEINCWLGPYCKVRKSSHQLWRPTSPTTRLSLCKPGLTSACWKKKAQRGWDEPKLIQPRYPAAWETGVCLWSPIL